MRWVMGIRSLLVAAGVAGAALLAGHGEAWAATIQVTTTADENGAGAACSLREAVTAANTDAAFGGCPAGSGNDKITFAAGANGMTLLGNGEIEITTNLEVAGNGAASTVIDGNDASRIFKIAGGPTVLISRLTVQNGAADVGAGISIGDGLVTIRDCVVRDNVASISGGGISSDSDVLLVTIVDTLITNNSAEGGLTGGGGINAKTAQLAITNSTISQNHATGTDSQGGGIRVFSGGDLRVTNSTIRNNDAGELGGGLYVSATATITDSIIAENEAAGGGGIHVLFNGDLTLTRSTVRDNKAASGGGLYNINGAVTLTNSTVSGNTASNSGGGIQGDGGTLDVGGSVITGNSGLGDGGGIDYAAGNVTLTSSTVSDNSSTAGSGGGISIGGSSLPFVTLRLTNSTVSGNTALNGGGIASRGRSSLVLTNSTVSGNSVDGVGGGISATPNLGSTSSLTNSTVSGNTAGGSGGGIFNDGDALTLTNATFSANSAALGGGIHNSDGTVNLRATVLDTGPSGANCAGGPAVTQGSNVADDATCFPNAGTDLVVANGGIKLGPLANNGGPTRTHALLPGSPAIDVVQGACAVNADQRGETRPQDGDGNGTIICDAGAFEGGGDGGVQSGGDDSTNRNGRGDRKDDAKETAEQRQQRERTNNSGKDDYATEGNVVEVHAEASPPYVVLANRDGLVKVVLLDDAAKQAASIRVGDYLQAEGEKQHEQLYEATDVTVTRGRGR